MNYLYAAAENLIALLDHQGWASCLIGGLANLRWSEPRQTKDVDLSVAAEWNREEPLVDLLLEFKAKDNLDRFERIVADSKEPFRHLDPGQVG